jgi:4-hydroxy-3-polyprenylbenzoate decarboxylase
MAYKSLHEFIKRLEEEGELKRIKKRVSNVLEITEITDRVCKNNGPALLFEQVEDYNIPVVTNMFGSMKRLAIALEVKDIEDISRRIEEIIKFELPNSFIGKFKLIPKFFQLASIMPKKVNYGYCKEVINKTSPDITSFPVLKCWPEDGGQFLTLPIVITEHPETKIRNVGMYRMQVYDSKTLGIHWHTHKDGAKHYKLWCKKNKKMPVAVCLGSDPAVIYSATLPLPEDFDELIFAGFLRNEPVELVRCETIDLSVPANSEIVIEGYVEPNELRLEGPFGDHTGYYSPKDKYPVFHITCITHRKQPIYPATITGKPPMEDCYLGKATVRILLPLIKLILPEIVDINLPQEGVFHNLAIVSIKKSYPLQAKKVMHSLWGLGQFMFTKTIIVVDDDVDVHNIKEVIWRVGNNIDPKRDIVFVEGPVDELNHAVAIKNFGSKMGIDATKKWKEEGYNREWPKEVKMSEEIKKKIDNIWQELWAE